MEYHKKDSSVLRESHMKTRLKYWRQRRAMTQHELAAAAGVSNQTIVNIERYGKEPIASTVRKLARALGITTEDFFTDDPTQADGKKDDEEQSAA
jgi:DNA-binding XRE family transcriptional regulator